MCIRDRYTPGALRGGSHVHVFSPNGERVSFTYNDHVMQMCIRDSFWFVVGGAWGPLTLIAYSVLRAWQTWLARYQTPHHRLQSGIDGILHIVDWLPVRLVGVVYALVGHGEKALPAWFASLGDRHSSQYQVLTRLAQYSLAREPHVDKVATPKAAVSMAKKTSLVVVVIMALLTIYGTLV